MSTPILATKLFIPPPRANIVLRPHLIERLNQGLAAGHKLTLISASAGCGKTTLVASWLAERRQEAGGRRQAGQPDPASCLLPPASWLSLDAGDSDLTRFLTYLVAALQTLAVQIGAGVLGVLQSPQPAPVEAILTALLNDVAAIPNQIILVIDDYHVIDSKPVDQAITFLIEHLPPQLHLVIASREDPHLPLARMRARGQLTELRAADLRFTPAEAAEFLNQMMGLSLSAEDIAALETRTEGWIAGLQLAALSMQGSKDISGFIRDFAGDHRYIVDYLVEEVLQNQPEPIRRFLLQTAILDQLNGPLCDALMKAEGSGLRADASEPQPSALSIQPSALVLAQLERANLFVIPLDDQRQWYRYHHLFVDVLRMHLMAEQPDLVPALHRRASEWYEQNGSPDNAIRHALAGKDFVRAANLIELVIPAINRRQQSATLLGWLKALPDDLVRLRPVLNTEYAFASLACGEIEAVEPRLRDAESPAAGMVVVNEAEFRRVPGMIALIRTAQALARGDMPETMKNAQRVLDLAPADDHLMLGGAASSLGLAAWTSGDLDAARRMTAEGMANVRLAGYISPAIGGAIVLADIQTAQGSLHAAMATYERGLQWATQPGAPVLRGAADMHVGMSALQREFNDLQTATQHLLTSQGLGELAGLPQNPYRWCAAMARVREAEGDLDAALDLLDQAERLYDANFSPNVRPIATRKTRVWLAQGRLSEALGWAREQGLSVEDELSYLREFDHITLARVLLARYQRDRADDSIQEAMGLLERLLQAAEAGGRKGSLIEILVLQALAHHAQGNLPAALLPLQHALMLAEPEGYVRTFVDEGVPMVELLERMQDEGGRMKAYTHTLLTAFGNQKEPHPSSFILHPLVEPLSPRELEVLRLIAQGLSNQEIGARLFLALDTVKGHTRRIYEKLQVQRRTEAVARARELGLL
jgi:LuxR family transcriptional regulator, maltose regulon positive regulatory protein